MADEHTRNQLLGDMIAYAEAKKIYSFYSALKAIILEHNEGQKLAPIIAIGIAFLKEHDPRKAYKAVHNWQQSISPTVTIPEEYRIFRPKLHNNEEGNAQPPASKRLSGVFKLATRFVARVRKLGSDANRVYISNGIKNAKTYADQGHYTQALDIINQLRSIGDGKYQRFPDVYNPVVTLLLNIVNKIVPGDEVSGQYFAVAARALAIAYKWTPHEDYEKINEITNIAAELLKEAEEHRRDGYCVELCVSVLRALKVNDANRQTIETFVERWGDNVFWLSETHPEKAIRKTENILREPRWYGHTLRAKAQALGQELREKMTQYAHEAKPVSPDEFVSLFESRVPTMG